MVEVRGTELKVCKCGTELRQEQRINFQGITAMVKYCPNLQCELFDQEQILTTEF